MLTKICKGCGEELPATNEYFNFQAKGKYGLNSRCKKCIKKNYEEHKKEINEAGRAYYKTNREKVLERTKAYNKNNKEKIKITYNIYAQKNKERIARVRKAYAEKNKEKLREYRKRYKLINKDKIIKYNNENSEKIKLTRMKYYLNNKEKLAKKQAEYYEKYKNKIKLRTRNYYIKNAELVKAKRKEYWELNKESIRAKDRMYSKTHRDIRNVICQKRRIKERELPKTLTAKQWKEIKIKFNNKCAYCGKEIKLTQDHFIPLTKGGEYTVNNIIPCCKNCNSSKHNKNFFDWYPQQKFYSEEREKIILKHLGYKKGIQQLKII